MIAIIKWLKEIIIQIHELPLYLKEQSIDMNLWINIRKNSERKYYPSICIKDIEIEIIIEHISGLINPYRSFFPAFCVIRHENENEFVAYFSGKKNLEREFSRIRVLRNIDYGC